MEVLGTALDEVFSSRAGAGVTAQRGRLGQGTKQTSAIAELQGTGAG
jgi:hypothetical protein